MARQDYHRPTDLDEALALLAQGGVTVAAGCTDLFPATEAPRLGGSILDITRVAGLRGVTRSEAGWHIGAATTWTDLLRADLPAGFDMLKQAAREVGSVQIQNAGTIAGNLCNASPAADGVPPLLALDATIELASASGRRCLPLSRFLTGPRRTARRPGELVTGIVIPASAAQGVSGFSKLGARRFLVISIAMAAARLELDRGHIRDAAVAVGACGPVAERLSVLEAALDGVPLARAAELVTGETVGAVLAPIDDIRADAGYRREAATELVRRLLARIAAAQ